MNVKHFRAKYQIEQYPVVFSFPGPVLYEPRVRVEVVSGVDPAPQAFAGLPFVKDNQVAILVVGGVPGVIYKISCEVDLLDEVVELSGVVAVKYTAGIVPEGTSALPLTLTLTTPPYPIYSEDAVLASANARKSYVYEFPLDVVETSNRALNSVLRTPLVTYNIPEEGVDTTNRALNSTLA